MKIFLGLTVFLIFPGGCSSSANQTVSKTNSNIANNSVAEMRNTNVAVSTNMEDFMNPNNVPPAPANSGLSNTPTQKIIKGKTTNVAPIDPNVRKILAPAPDNSEISTEMNKQGQPIETRTFKSNALLAKVERIYITLDNPTVKVYLKNGKIIDLPKGRIDNIFDASANEILKAVGIAPPNENPPSKENVEKKEKQ
ncbi:MAG: hypothetical protein ACR2MG_07760 [Pyrinomonadaceae bacterium]